MIRFLPLLILFCLTPSATVRAQAPASRFTGPGLTVELVSEMKVIQPGQTFHLGLWIRHDPGYHTYWKNPGLAGVPTTLAAQLPAGFTAGELIYPPPDKVRMAGIRVHGYEREVLVALPVTAPAALPPGPLSFPAEAAWMCCQRTCNPGHAKLSLTLQGGAAGTPDETWQAKFADLLARQPPTLTGWSLTARRFEKEIELTALPPAGMALPETPQFFSLDNLICSHPVQSWQRDGSGYRVRLALSDFLPDDQSQLRGLLFGKGSWLPGREAPYAAIAVTIVPTKP